MSRWNITELKIMKKGTLLLTLALLIIAFSSCDKVEDGAYSPKEKISKIYFQSNYSGEKELDEVWNWDDKQLKSIDYYLDGGYCTEHYSYNKDGRIEAVLDFGYEEVVQYEYDGKKLSKAYYYDCGELSYEYDFIYDGKKISEIGLTINEDEFYKKDSHKLRVDPLSMIVPELDVVKVKKLAKKANLSKDVTYRIPIKLEWDGDNISKMSMDIEIEGFTVGMKMEYKYDDKLNPYKNILTLYLEETLNYEFSKNNVTEITITDIYGPESITDTEVYSYTYDGQYPVTKTYDFGTEYYEYE